MSGTTQELLSNSKVPAICFQPDYLQEPDCCPLCGSCGSGEKEDRIHLAAHCCLWKYFGHAERVSIADRVERGMSWEDAINGGTR